MSAKLHVGPGVDTLPHAALLVSRGQASCSGIHRDGRAWIGFGYHVNDNGREVVAPAIVLFLPASAEDIAACYERLDSTGGSTG